VSEIRDIILGMEIAPPSQQRQQIAEIEKQARSGTTVTETTTKSVNVHGDELVVTTTSAYEQAVFASRTDWRVRAISASNLHLRTQHLYVASDVATLGVADAGFTFVLPKNVLKKFIVAADLRTQIGALIYGLSPAENPQVKEIRALVFPPQTGSHTGVTLPSATPEHESLAGLELLGWIHTQPAETQHLPPSDAVAHARLLEAMPSCAPASAIVLTVSFTPGSASLVAHRLTAAGASWAKAALKDAAGGQASASLAGYSPAHAEKAPLLLSDRFLGFLLVPAPDGAWNFNFQGVRFAAGAKYALQLAPAPRAFYDEAHRPQQFLSFGGGGREGDGAAELVEDPLAR
jgi:pre-mRNA-processing factor 8